MPRRSSASLTTLTPPPPTPRLVPPADMADDARQVFLDVVLANDPTYFKPSDMPLLCRYAEANALAGRAAAALLKVGPVVNDKVSSWLAVHAVATKEVTALAARLRLSPQSRQPNNPRSARSQPTNYYERLAMERTR